MWNHLQTDIIIIYLFIYLRNWDQGEWRTTLDVCHGVIKKSCSQMWQTNWLKHGEPQFKGFAPWGKIIIQSQAHLTTTVLALTHFNQVFQNMFRRGWGVWREKKSMHWYWLSPPPPHWKHTSRSFIYHKCSKSFGFTSLIVFLFIIRKLLPSEKAVITFPRPDIKIFFEATCL